MLRSITSSSGHVMASGDHGSDSVVPVSSAINDRGDRIDTPAQTPSAPSPRPRVRESRWLSQRSTPRAGTTTSSSAKEIGLRRRQQFAEAVSKQIGALGAVDVKGHRNSI